MKLNKSQLKQIVKEAIGDPRTEMESINYHLMRHQQWLSRLFSEFGKLNEDVNKLRLDLNDFMSTGERPSRFSEPDIIPGKASLSVDTSPGGKPRMEGIKITRSQLKQIIKEELENLSETAEDVNR